MFPQQAAIDAEDLSRKYFERALRVCPGGVHSPVRAFKGVGGTPIFFRSAQGAKLISVDGREYIDFCQSFGPLMLGHRDPDVSEAVREAIDTAWSFGACEPYSLELAEWITSRLSWVEMLRFVSSGTEAVMSALRVARAATKRNRILKFEGCYHGHSEPLPANYGLLIQRREFIDEVMKLARANGALVIFDEVISGFRVALGGMTQVLGMKPDLVTYGKVIGGGFPVAAYGGRRDLMELVAPVGPV